MKQHTRSLVHLIQSLAINKPKLAGCEVGVWKGENAADVLRTFPGLTMQLVDRYLQLNTAEVKIDKRMGARTQADFDAAWQAALDNTKFARDRTKLLVMTSAEAASRTMDACFDFVFIDGMHDYENVRTDITLWFPKVRFGGILCGHDYAGMGDRRGKFGVKRAVDEFAKTYNKDIGTKPGNVWWCCV